LSAAEPHGNREMGRTRVLAVASHPIQYHAPWFRELAQAPSLDFSVLFIQKLNAQQQGRGFGIDFSWDLPLLDGYRSTVATNVRGPLGLGGFFAARLARPTALLQELRPQVVLLTGWQNFALMQMLRAANRLRIPVVMRGESNALRQRPWPVRMGHRALLSRCRAFLPIGRASRAFYRSYGIPEERLFDAPYFVDNNRFERAAAELEPHRDHLRARWGIRPDAACFCFAGKLEPKKRLLDLLEALRIALTDPVGRPLHLLVVGDGELIAQARALVTQHRLPVTFAGFLNQGSMAEAYVASDCLVLPSDFGETWGLVVNEAMACGRPAIVSDRAGCAADLVSSPATGATFPFGDTAALAAALRELSSDPQRLREMGVRARELVTGQYSVEASARATLRAIDYVRSA
jgi:glycosyltransferase involved in cell wall biosynthesis